ncbi:MAG: ABC transporter ATP-binding protein [Melioribacteraceae bacterium]|nr:ABC transporter ATP-binding protein [Melioribacteraceae bacterium]MCF8354236.1 ABC transporter ATP-binding protein [Melioribacteraceae bacterium]MCF8394733.1 ABC transporter ATP-binding protein [Melioribacteraceae bacterium]MCF8417967.1 ABC transporter ATP-binding protein [Melioribacteraceae bacterium]
MSIVEINNLTKIYSGGFKRNSVTALQDFSLTVEPGTIYGLLGPNGAGKTTLVKVLLGITFPTSGEAKIFGKDISDYTVRQRIGYLPENHKFPSYLNGGEVLKFFAEMSGYKDKNLNNRIDELLDIVKMRKWKRTKIKNYSKGMMQRLGLAQAMINDPDLIFLDEPTDGVDPIGRKEIRDLLQELKSGGKTIFLNSHLLSEVELVTDRATILHKGKLVRQGTMEELTTQKEEFRIRLNDPLDENLINTDLKDYNLKMIGESFYSFHARNVEQLNGLIDILRKYEINIHSIVPQKNTLEEMFISVIEETENLNNAK